MAKSMTKSAIIAHLAQKTDLSKKQITDVMDQLLSLATKEAKNVFVLPNFGRLEPNVYYLQGYSGHGMVATTIAGRIAAEAIAGQAERFDIFARLKHHDFPGGKIGRAHV